MCCIQTSSRNYFDGSALNASMLTDCIRQHQWESVSPAQEKAGAVLAGNAAGLALWEWKTRRAKCCWSPGLTPTAAPV